MSNHLEIKGDVEYIHLPDGDHFGYCHHCKKNKLKLTVRFHEGMCSDWIEVICPHCKKVIWIAELTSMGLEDEKGFKRVCKDGRVLINDNTKCKVCKKPTNRFDCESYWFDKNKISCVCSEKCEEKEKILEEEDEQFDC